MVHITYIFTVLKRLFTVVRSFWVTGMATNEHRNGINKDSMAAPPLRDMPSLVRRPQLQARLRRRVYMCLARPYESVRGNANEGSTFICRPRHLLFVQFPRASDAMERTVVR